MSSTVRCPHCGTIKSVTRNMQYVCKCGAYIVIDNEGRIKRTTPKKKK